MIPEPDRLKALLSYDILDTPPEAHFDDIVHLAQRLCSAPVAFVSLVAADRQWFKARAGFDVDSTPLHQSVCVHAIKEDEILIVPDLRLDPRTEANTLVTQPPHFRFYAGAVLRAPAGEALGALCVLDYAPRPEGLTPDQTDNLLALGRQTMALMQYRRALNAQEKAIWRSAYYVQGVDQAQQAGGIGSFEIDIAADTIAPTPEFCRLFGVPFRPVLPAAEIEVTVLPQDQGLMSSRASRAAGNSLLDVQYRIRRPSDGVVRWIARRGGFERDAEGRPVKLFGTVQDVTERRAKEDDQNVLNRELSHRIKNTLSMVDAIALQTLSGAADQEALKNFSKRVLTLSRAHDILLQQSWQGASLRLVIQAVLVHAAPDRFVIDGPDIELGARSVLSFSLLLHELATNAVKYGALSMPAGKVHIDWAIDQKGTAPDLVLQWREQGGPPVEPPRRRGFGTRLIRAGLSGTGNVDLRYDQEGLHAVFRVPVSYFASS